MQYSLHQPTRTSKPCLCTEFVHFGYQLVSSTRAFIVAIANGRLKKTVRPPLIHAKRNVLPAIGRKKTLGPFLAPQISNLYFQRNAVIQTYVYDVCICIYDIYTHACLYIYIYIITSIYIYIYIILYNHIILKFEAFRPRVKIKLAVLNGFDQRWVCGRIGYPRWLIFMFPKFSL